MNEPMHISFSKWNCMRFIIPQIFIWCKPKKQSMVTLIIYFYCFLCFAQIFCFISLCIHTGYSFFCSIKQSGKTLLFNNARQFSHLSLISFISSHISILRKPVVCFQPLKLLLLDSSYERRWTKNRYEGILLSYENVLKLHSSNNLPNQPD